jgi:hypothetical protein
LNEQYPKLQALFVERLSEIYRGHWDLKHMMHEVGVNLQEKRAQLRKKFKCFENWKLVSIPIGCLKYS